MHELSDYDYHLPPEYIAREPPERREDARLMVVRRDEGTISHHAIRELPQLLSNGDCLVLNNTRVIPARLFGYRTATGGRWEGLFLEADPDGTWQLIGETRGKLQPGESLTLVPAHGDEAVDRVEVELLDRSSDGTWTARPRSERPALDLLEAFGTVPLPPYIGRRLATHDDRERYQTVFAEQPGAIAAPTAGLHLTPELLSECSERGIASAQVTLHVGVGTFRPINVDRLEDHVMHSERCRISADVVDQLHGVREGGGRIVAIGTTAVRTLETAAAAGALAPFEGSTDLFIKPPWKFQSVDCLLTNFHLPKSTLLVLVSALAGQELIRSAYETAIAERYRFFSYGDAMLIL